MRVLIADDTALLRQGLARLLTEAGIEVVWRGRRRSGTIRLVEEQRPDVAVVDIRMPPSHTDEGLVAAASFAGASPSRRARPLPVP